MKKSQKIIYYLSIIGLLVSLAFLCLGIKGISGIHQASEYTDEGVYTFVPYRVSAITVENTSTGRDKRIHPTKTIYAVYYHTLEKSVYQWKVETGNSKADANRILQAKKQVKKRVFTRKSSEEYIVVEEELSVDTYVKRQVYRYACMIVLPIGYLICLWIFWRLKKRRSKLVKN